ncbi:MAG TPA: hypothetical protein PLI51_06340, partial [bacterium]|nr:hypothetical protein [bacterium]
MRITLLAFAAWLTQSTLAFGSGWVTTTLAARADIFLSRMSMARDGENNFYVAYRDLDGGSLKFADNTRGVWRTATIAGGGEDASIAVDAAGHAHVSYRSGSTLYYATNASGDWETSALAGSAYMSDIALDPAGKVHISYFDQSSYRLRYATNASGDWVFTTVDDTLDSDSGYTSIGVDTYYYAHISYSFGNYYDEETHYELKYATNSSGSWAAFTVNSSGHIGRDTSLALDSSNYVHIASFETEWRSLQYTTNASGDWVTETADPGTSASLGYRPSIGVDSDDKAHISYYNASGWHLKYATNASGSWTQQTLDPYSGANIGYNSSLVVDSDDYIHIAYDYNHQYLKYIRNTTGSFDLFDAYVIDGTEDPVGLWTSLALDAEGYPHVAFQNTYHLRYGYPDQGVWFVDQAVNGGNVGSYANLVLDGSGAPAIAYYDAMAYDLNLASFAPGTSWVVSTLDGFMKGAISMTGDAAGNLHLCYKNDDNWGTYPLTAMTNETGTWGTTVLWDESHYGYSNSIAVDSRDIEHIAWYYNNAGGTERLNYATDASGSWANTQIDNAVGNVRIGGCCSVAVDTYYYAHISYYDADGGNLKYATNASGSWATQTLFSDGNTGLYNSIALDGSDHAHVTYYFATAGCLMYATDASGSWVQETVDAAAGTGLYTSLALDADGLPRVSYYDLTHGRLKFAYLVLPSPTPSPTPEGYKTPTPSPSASPSPTPTRSPVPTPSAVP